MHEVWSLVGQSALRQLPASFVEYLAADLDARVVARIEVVNERDSAAERAAAEVEELVVRQ
jgi:hypothetical protein